MHEAPACVTVNVRPPAVIVPDRGDVVGFAAAVNPTDPEPEPLAPLVMVIHAALLEAVQSQPADVVTVRVPDPPAATTNWPVGEMEKAHDDPAWLTMNVWPPTEIVPVRANEPVFGAALKVTVPGPDPLEPPVMVIHAAPLTAVHAQPVLALTEMVPVPPAVGSDALVDASVTVHDAPAWVTVNVCPATEIVPVRGKVPGLAATVNATVPSPDPVAPPVMVIHAAPLAAAQLQPALAETATVPVPPAPGTDWLVGLSV